jgi:hypothetical protein
LPAAERLTLRAGTAWIPGLLVFEPPQLTMTALDARSRLSRLQAERLIAVEAGLGANSVYMTDLHVDMAAAHAAYVGLAMTEVATLRAELGGAQIGWTIWIDETP